MASLALILQYLHPTSVPFTDWRVTKDGGQESITSWNAGLLGPQPPVEDLLAHSAAADAALAAHQLGPVPPEIGPFQSRESMLALGFITPSSPENAYAELDSWIDGRIEAAISDPAQRAQAKRGWRHATGFKRNYALIELIRVASGKTQAQIDQLFRLAATI
jgi:hypothetical protein